MLLDDEAQKRAAWEKERTTFELERKEMTAQVEDLSGQLSVAMLGVQKEKTMATSQLTKLEAELSSLRQ